MPKRLDPQEGGGLGGEGLDPSPLRPGHAHGFRLSLRAPGIAASKGTAVGKGGNGRGCSR